MKNVLAMGLIVVAMSLFFMIGCERMDTKPVENQPPGEAIGKQGAPDGGISPLPMPASAATILFKAASGDVPIGAEIAESDADRARGLMGRESLPENSGMWFVFPQSGHEKFWMKETKIPLDLIYVNEEMKVVYVKENAAPNSTDLIESPAEFRYILETNAGTAARHGIRVGDVVEKRLGPK